MGQALFDGHDDVWIDGACDFIHVDLGYFRGQDQDAGIPSGEPPAQLALALKHEILGHGGFNAGQRDGR